MERLILFLSSDVVLEVVLLVTRSHRKDHRLVHKVIVFGLLSSAALAQVPALVSLDVFRAEFLRVFLLRLGALMFNWAITDLTDTLLIMQSIHYKHLSPLKKLTLYLFQQCRILHLGGSCLSSTQEFID